MGNAGPLVERRLHLPSGQAVSALSQTADDGFACLVLAHGAGAGMLHPFLVAVAAGLAERGVATLRFQFPFMEAGSRRPDRPAIAHEAVRAAVAAEAGLPLFAGGKSFGARMVSQAQAASALPGVRGLVFFGFPLHPAKQPATHRADHLTAVSLPMLFLQGTRDALAEPRLLHPVVAGLDDRATLIEVADADHSFHVPARTGRSDGDVLEALLDDAVAWMQGVLRRTETGPAAG